ncbi:class I SAM-dependent methyltransferase [Aspergillus undulatus]|uniref:class I SAM-dependent methyltransferase n=1 Tax=Aspergillus undulatus TaxID=1810928 RepID=UPI003CCDF85B
MAEGAQGRALRQYYTVTVPVDNDFPSDEDETYSSEIESYATSLTSSVMSYKWEYGRRYHSYKEGSYKFPNDEREQDRLDVLHHMFKLVLGERLFLAPIEDGPLRVLDIGTGTGLWAIEFADEFPSAQEVTGNDLSPIQPPWVPPNVIFEVDDAEADWPDRAPFDFVHSRYMCGSIEDWPRLAQQAYAQLKPGGWIEFQDFNLVNYSEDGSLKDGNNVNRFYELLRECCDKINRPVTIGKELRGVVERAGFVNVHERVFQLPLGTWPRERRMKDIGALNLYQMLDGLEAFSAATFTNILGWSIEEVQVLLALVRKDAKDRSVHMMHDFHVVYAQKPMR